LNDAQDATTLRKLPNKAPEQGVTHYGNFWGGGGGKTAMKHSYSKKTGIRPIDYFMMHILCCHQAYYSYVRLHFIISKI